MGGPTSGAEEPTGGGAWAPQSRWCLDWALKGEPGAFGAERQGRPPCRSMRREPAGAGRDPEKFGVAETWGEQGMVAQRGGTKEASRVSQRGLDSGL